jgi:hypothetical protein
MRQNPSGKLNLVMLLCVIAILFSGCFPFENETQPSRDSGADDTLSMILTDVARENPTPQPSSTPTLNPTLEWINQEIGYGQVGVFIIVGAIDRFYEDHGVYPDDLSELVPIYLEELPSTISGASFYYYQNDTVTYAVTFFLESKGGENTTAYCGYYFSQDLWECGGSGP